VSDAPDQELTPAQRAAAGHLELLRADPPSPGATLARRVMRTTRWQQALRAPLRVVAMIGGSVLDAMSLIRRRGSSR
jgi:hypothetical protein